MSGARRSAEHVAAVCDTAALPCAVIGGVYRCVSDSSVWVRWLQSDTMSSKGGGTALTRRNYRLASDMDKPRSTGMNAQSLQHSCPPIGLSESAVPLPGIVNEKLLSDYLHHVFPSTKQGPTVASLR